MIILLIFSLIFVKTNAATPKNTVTKLFLIDYNTIEGSAILKSTKELIQTKNETEEAVKAMNKLYDEYMKEYYPNEKCWVIRKFEVKSLKHDIEFEHWMIIDRKCYNAARIIRVVAAFIGFTVLFVVTSIVMDQREKRKLEAQNIRNF